MDILILTGYDDNMQELGDICLPSKRAYAERNGYAFECVREYPKDVHPSWHKLQLLRERIDKFDAILWLDADTIVTNPEKVIHEFTPRYVLMASADWCSYTDRSFEMPSMGNFMLFNNPFTQGWIASAMAEEYRFSDRPMWEQSAIQECMRAMPEFNEMVDVRPRRWFNSVHPTCRPHGKDPGAPWQPGDFLIHLTGVENRIELAKEFAALAGC